MEFYCITTRWRRDSWEIKLMEQPDEHYSLVGGNLVINNPRQKKHAGTYICVARNIYGTVISKEARVKFGCEYVNAAGAADKYNQMCSCDRLVYRCLCIFFLVSYTMTGLNLVTF